MRGSSWLGLQCEVREGAHGTAGVRKEFGMEERSDEGLELCNHTVYLNPQI